MPERIGQLIKPVKQIERISTGDSLMKQKGEQNTSGNKKGDQEKSPEIVDRVILSKR